jgi:hypothetical protein
MRDGELGIASPADGGTLVAAATPLPADARDDASADQTSLT